MSTPTPSTFRRLLRPVHAALLLLTPLTLAACSSTIPRKEPAKKSFPEVHASSLDGKAVAFPQDLKGAPAVLLVGYAQKAQFDIDRWILGLKQLESNVKIVELPTIKGMLPGMASNFIDSGMRRGIPQEDWSSVVTVYSDADAIVNLTGNENPNNARVFLLDKSGNIVWFFDRGYSADKVLELEKTAQGL